MIKAVVSTDSDCEKADASCIRIYLPLAIPIAELEHNDESSAVIIISGDPSHIGEILEVNAAASNLFG